MRWRFYDAKNPNETSYRRVTQQRIDAWWRVFEAHAKQLDSLFAGKSKWDLPAWMAENLQVIDGQDGLEGSDYSGRDEIEAAITKALISDSLGGVIGGGTGIRYSYVDLVLTDLERAVASVRKVLREGQLPKRSWILFFDADHCGEWVGIYDDTPSPPVPDPEEAE